MNQVAVSDRAGLTLALGLRSLLRQDPNVVMVGELRDLETAQIALEAAQTGQLVLSTIAAGDAAGAAARLVEMGVPVVHGGVVARRRDRAAARAPAVRLPAGAARRARALGV